MRLLEIQEGVCVKIDKIEGIMQLDNGTCEVYVGTRTYVSTIPYETLMSMLKTEYLIDKNASKDEQITKTMKKLDGVLNTTGYFAG